MKNSSSILERWNEQAIAYNRKESNYIVFAGYIVFNWRTSEIINVDAGKLVRSGSKLSSASIFET